MGERPSNVTTKVGLVQWTRSVVVEKYSPSGSRLLAHTSHAWQRLHARDENHPRLRQKELYVSLLDVAYNLRHGQYRTSRRQSHVRPCQQALA